MRTDALPSADTQTISSLRLAPPPAALAEDGYAPEQEEGQDQDRGLTRGQEEGEEREQEELDQGQEQEQNPPGSPAFSTASTVDDESSPILPPLPAPTLRGHTFEDHQHHTPSASPSASSSHPSSSHYYTASWGSPYQQPVPGSRRTRSHGQSYSLSSETSGDSPIRHLEFHTPFLRPAPTFPRLHTDPEFVSHDGLISAAVLANRARRPATGLTEDWIRRHTGGQSAERNHWLSDEGGSERSSPGGSEARDWLGGESDPRTPTRTTFSQSREAKSRPKHRRQLTTDTLTQEDFAEDVLDQAIPTMSLTNEPKAGVQMGMSRSSPEEDSPPPVPPKEWQAAVLPTRSLTPTPALPRLKKKVLWKGKNIMVLLPWDDERGQKGKAPTPLSEKDMAAMLKDWEQLGYDTTGFNLGPEPEDRGEGSRGQSRSPWPLGQDMANERAQRSFRVSIPDRREWDAYVEGLQEAKLQALLGALGDKPPAISPAVSNLNSRRASMQYPALPFSPPLPTSSAASSHITHQQNNFSPLLAPGAGISTSQSSNPGSVASPASMHARYGSVASPGPMHMPGKYNRNQSISFGGEHPFGSPFQYPQQSSPGVWSPQQMLYQQSAARAGSPPLQNLNVRASPVSSFSQDGYFAQGGDMLSQMQQRQQLLQTQLAHQQQLQLQSGARASPRLPEVKETEEEEVESSKSPSKTPEARLRNNPNDLQKEIDDAEYHLEEQMQRELEHDDYSPHPDKSEDTFPLEVRAVHKRNTSSMGLAGSRFASEPSDGPVLHHPQPHSRGHSLSQRPFQDDEEDVPALKKVLGKSDLSDIETNPSKLGTPVQSNEPSGSGHNSSTSIVSNHWGGSDASAAPNSGHITRASTSGLNVAAKEFRFDPSTSSQPGQISFGSSFQSSINAFPSFQPSVSAASSQSSLHRVASSKRNINVAAPAFVPGSLEFNFSTSGPVFRPDAPAFTPFSSTLSDSVGSGIEANRSSIFGNIDISALGISKPAKKNKAIPIVRPHSSHKSIFNDDVEDKDGRITQGEARFKRAKGGKDDGDSVPLFAAPSQPLGETSREQSPPEGRSGSSTSPADKENTAPEPLEEGEIAEDIPPKAGKEWAPWDFHEEKEAEDLNAPGSFASQTYGSGVPVYAAFVPSEDEAVEEPQKSKGHTKNISSLSAKAKPFDFKPGTFDFTFGQSGSPSLSQPVSMPVSTGLSASRYARSPTPPARQATPVAQSPETDMQPHERAQFQCAIPQPESLPPYPDIQETGESFREQTLEDIDEVMRLMNQADSAPTVYQPSPKRHISMPDPENSSPIRLLPKNAMRSDAPSPSPRRFKALPGESKIFSRVHEDPFVAEESPLRHLHNDMLDSVPLSEWDDVLSETEEAKLHPRAQFFDNHVNDLVGGLLSQRIKPLERTLGKIQMSLDMMSTKGQSMRERRSISGPLSSDADDEDDDNPRRSMSPRRDKKLDKIKSIVIEALASQESRPATANANIAPDSSLVLRALEEMKEQFGSSMRLDLRGEDIRNIIDEAVQKRLPASPKPFLDEEALAREVSYKAKIAELEERLLRIDSDSSRRSADLEEKLLCAESRTEEETKTRRAAEDRLAEVQRLLRISSEEETRLREVIDERELKTRSIVDAADAKVRAAEEQRAKTSMRIALLEAAQTNSQKDHTELQYRLNSSEAELRDARKEIQRWQLDAERALDAAKRHSEDAEMANETNAGLQRTVHALQAQMEESIRVREVMRGRLTEAQADMASAARSIASDLAITAKKEAESVARQEVLDAKLQAEARTRERLELEIERLEKGEREGMKAVSELRRVNVELEEVKKENDRLERESGRFKREFEEARESGLSEVQRTRHYMQLEIDTANNQVNVVREALEHTILQLKSEIDQIKLDSDTAHTKSEMLLEEAETSKQTALKDLQAKFADREEDLLTRHERALGNKEEDAQRNEQHLLERLSLSSAKTEHLQDRVAHLEEKLEIANKAAAAAVSAAKTARSASTSSSPFAQGNHQAQGSAREAKRGQELPEKISPQALRESIMVLQEQLQARESTIESLSSQLETVDTDAPSKIQKRDDEISWLRELLSVRKSDLQDIVAALETERYDPDRVRDAAIRLRANLQMEEQERERKEIANGAGIVVDNLARLRDAAIASPRVAQAVGPLAAAWGNWRKGRAVDVDAGSSSSTPSRANSPARPSLLGGLLTPPANPNPAPRQGDIAGGRQPTAFGSTGQRFTSAQLANRPRNSSSNRSSNNSNPLLTRTPDLGQEQSSVRGQSSARGQNSPAKSTTTTSSMTGGPRVASGRKRGTFGGGILGGQDLATGAGLGSAAGFGRDIAGGDRGGVTTPPMMRQSSYDADARGLGEDGEFSDAGFYDDESFGGEGEGFEVDADNEGRLDG
ncbi:myosin class II heavy chain [Diplocarpon rosae]|nr:myosin class II heavy chain [Diplocarpon rosae]